MGLFSRSSSALSSFRSSSNKSRLSPDDDIESTISVHSSPNTPISGKTEGVEEKARFPRTLMGGGAGGGGSRLSTIAASETSDYVPPTIFDSRSEGVEDLGEPATWGDGPNTSQAPPPSSSAEQMRDQCAEMGIVNKDFPTRLEGAEDESESSVKEERRTQESSSGASSETNELLNTTPGVKHVHYNPDDCSGTEISKMSTHTEGNGSADGNGNRHGTTGRQIHDNKSECTAISRASKTSKVSRTSAVSRRSTVSCAGDVSMNEIVQEFVKTENALQVASYVTNQADKLRKLAQDGPLSFKVLAFMGGCAMIVTSGMELLYDLVVLSPISALIAVYTLLFGVAICFLEGKMWACPLSYEKTIEEYAKFLQYVWGRGCLYFFAGSLQLSQMNINDIFVGGFMCFVGITSILLSIRTAKKLAQLSGSIYDRDVLEEKFRLFDHNQDGYLEYSEFISLVRSFGLDLDHNEFVAAISVIDRDHDGKISHKAFTDWWVGFQYVSTENGQMMV